MSHYPHVYFALFLLLVINGFVVGFTVMLATGALIVVLIELLYRLGYRRFLATRSRLS